jgi:hypothetical protein
LSCSRNDEKRINFILLFWLVFVRCFHCWFVGGEEKKNYDLMKSFNLPTEQLITCMSSSNCFRSFTLVSVSRLAYNVTIWRKIPFAGTAYITRNYVIFSSPMMNKFVTIPFTEVCFLFSLRYSVAF